ncbi:lysine exporter protein LysE-YggA [Marine Group I thaumarchaeote SCGC AAA799-E16]|uniref:Lysine exporter protein LysE-YggA n=5 Tax=Marine Group I TaxID=905826 RepID=A0A087S9C9_9ARCH|nr:lysine exporter protein LysE-YggA [Marine Group I thaumarchaeote SCGC AAA799-E16]KFM16440.1 lysine exporter protein LysE-YggA [Marine Group I thaumarchaeote SCGC AAA799-D11]KFM18406.1 lysine exporter protein LysE-YggA [Marine Group I thaumarchaeote SCGC RSA3]KFM22333.1 lysine exporter protein LysE-YggA [Marine Group I thaumarchaeote SCGC AAA799-B03]
MEQFLEFAVLVIVISASGVMAPGPLFAANISYGLREGTKSGIKMATGHAIVELPLVILLGIGVFSLESFPEFRTIISILGAITLFIFAALQIRTVLKNNEFSIKNQKQGALITGVLLSGLNPFFIIWWLTIGFKLISDAMLIWAFSGMLIMFGLHIWMDFAWLGTVSYLASKSKKILSNRNYKVLMIGLSGMLIYFGITFLQEVQY